MASVCACTLALMDAGVPIKAPVAGISIGLATDKDGESTTLTDIQGMEDHYGAMDFKVAGTAEGITAIQLDIKLNSISFDVIEAALPQAREARLAILDRMNQTISAPRDEMSPYAPRMTRITIPIDKIGALIGPGGKTIRGIVEETGATVDVDDDGTVTIGSSDGAAAKRAIEIVEGLTREVKVGDIFTGKVVRILNFGAFVEILPGTDGMVHISELADHRVPTVEDVVQLGEEITVEVIGVDPSGKIALSRRALLEGGDASERATARREEPDRGRPDEGGRGPRPGDGRPRDGGPDRSGPRSQGGWRGGDQRRSGPRPPAGRPPPR
jgi:polyribonucleotide nucleotidyltransferase